MTKSNELIAEAAKYVGYSRYNDPANGTKFGRWYAEQVNNSYYAQNGVPFCAMAVSYWLNSAGITCAGFPTAGCGSAMNGAIAKGAWHSGSTGISAGAVVIFDWNGNGGHDHTGICTAVNNGSISTIEGNTGNGQVLRRERANRYVQGYIIPNYDGGTPKGAIDVDGLWGSATTRLAQTLAGTYVDGIVSSQNPDNKRYLEGCTTGWEWVSPYGVYCDSALICTMQKQLRDFGKYYGDIDGLAGQQFASAMIRYFAENWGSGATVDDKKLDAGGVTIKAFQRMLNAGKFF